MFEQKYNNAMNVLSNRVQRSPMVDVETYIRLLQYTMGEHGLSTVISVPMSYGTHLQVKFADCVFERRRSNTILGYQVFRVLLPKKKIYDDEEVG